MGLSEEQRHQAAQDIFEAEATQNWTTPVSLRGDADVEDAYAIGALVTELKVAAGRVVKGHKVGLTSKPMRAMFDTDEPDYGTLVDDMFLDEGSLISRSHMNRPLVEIELAFVLGDELGGADTTAADVMQATACVVPAIEIVDGRFAAEAPIRWSTRSPTLRRVAQSSLGRVRSACTTSTPAMSPGRSMLTARWR